MMKQRLLIFCRSKVQRAPFSRLSSQYDLEFREVPSVGRDMTTPFRAVVVYLDAQTMNGTPPNAYFGEVETLASGRPIIAVVDEHCPLRLEQLARSTADACFTSPLQLDHLSQVITATRDPASDMADLCTGLPHKVLHGRTRSLITFTPSMFDIFEELKVASAHEVTILLIGETGSGKTYLAHLMHELSSRHADRFLAVACGALPPDLLESEMFGYVKGAFTGADRNKEGKFAAAGRGTLLLDEIDVLPLEQQAKLLRVIETGEFEPVGSNETQTSAARLIVASNYDLEELVDAGTFRQDLYYRLNVLKFSLPPLRERPSDIEYLARNFALAHSRKHNITLHEIDTNFIDLLRTYRWPGNIRELENVIRRAVLYSRNGVLTGDELPASIRGVADGSKHSAEASQNSTLEEKVGLVERRIIEDTLRRNKNHRQQTAKELGISRVTLYNKMKKFGMMSSDATV